VITSAKCASLAKLAQKADAHVVWAKKEKSDLERSLRKTYTARSHLLNSDNDTLTLWSRK